ncbi:MAG TPA: hypothetical protein VF691_11165 [Cytophagaceae bacterium]|jgi:hypothetical protein
MRGKKEGAEKKLEKFFSEAVIESEVPLEVKEDFEVQSPLLKEQVIERISDISLDAVDDPAIEEIKESQAFTAFGMPSFSVAPEAKKSDPFEDRPFTDTQSKEEEKIPDDLPKMSLESEGDKGEPVTMKGLQKKAGQTTAKWSWTLFENAGPKVQMFFSEIDEAEIRKLVIEDLLPAHSLEFTKDYNKSLEDEFEVKEWEKELIYPPLEELLEQAGMNTSMSPAARLGVGISVVLGARAMQTKKYREEREELLERLMNSYAKTKSDVETVITPTT